jgi:hypothetical protein
MRRLRVGSLIALIAIVPLFAPLLADDKSLEESLRRNTQELMDALGDGKPDVWERLLDARVSYTDEGGAVLDKKTLVEGAKGLPKGVLGTIVVKDFRATVHGDVAVTTYVSDENENYHGHKLHCQYRTTDTWKETKAGWRLVAGQVLALRTDPPEMAADADDLEEYCGRYALTPELGYEIRCTDHGLEGQATGKKPEPLRMEAPDVFFVPGKVRYRFIFQRDEDGAIAGFSERREAWDLVYKRVTP